ncbi:hypothetical protein A7Q09_07765 [Methylacidiphilum sp. Yel]|nr:hypothetical protein A7Q09_07765 [Methylacidiphilum sp. Yel]
MADSCDGSHTRSSSFVFQLSSCRFTLWNDVKDQGNPIQKTLPQEFYLKQFPSLFMDPFLLCE